MLLAFGDHVLDSEQRELRCGAELVAVEPQVFDLLVYLVQHHDRVVSKDDLLQAVWGGRIVSDAALAARINAARRALGDNGKAQRWIRTLPRKGVRFIGALREEPEAAPASSPPPRLSIVVLPFVNLSNDPAQEYFADGITDDLTTELSRIAGSFVIARGTAFTYKGKSMEVKQIGYELGVRSVLAGSVQRSGNQVRVNAQLIDAATGAQLWTERYDRDVSDRFSLQDEITSRISHALRIEIVGAEAARPVDQLDATDYVFRGRASFFGMRSAADAYAERISMFERALALNPQSVDAQTWLAIALAGRALDQLSDSPAVDIARAERLITQALAASPRSYFMHWAKGQVLRAQGRCEEAIPEFEMAFALKPNAGMIAVLGECRFFAGSIDDMIPLQERAIQLSPRDPFVGHWYQRIGVAHLLQSRIEEAIVWLNKARTVNPGRPPPHAYLAAACALAGEAERASAELAEVRRLNGDNRYSSITCLKAAQYWGVPKVRALFEATYYAGLRKAGMPEG